MQHVFRPALGALQRRQLICTAYAVTQPPETQLSPCESMANSCRLSDSLGVPLGKLYWMPPLSSGTVSTSCGHGTWGMPQPGRQCGQLLPVSSACSVLDKRASPLPFNSFTPIKIEQTAPTWNTKWS